MDRFVSHDDLMESLGAYALDALDPDEMATLQRHLGECPRCAAEVLEHQNVAALLGNVGGETPAHLWDAIADRLETDQARGPDPLPSIGGPRSSRGSERMRWTAQVVKRPWVLVAAAAVVAIAILSLQVSNLNNRVGTLNSLGSERNLGQLAQGALANPDAQRVTLTSATTGRPAAEVVVLPSGSAYLVNEALPALPSSETYQLWGKADGQLISLGVLGNAPRTVAFTLRASSAYADYLLTAERAGGVVQTTHRPLASGGAVVR